MSNEDKARWTKIAAFGTIAAFVLGLFVYIIGASWSLSSKVEARPTRIETHKMIETHAAPKADTARCQEGIRYLRSNQRRIHNKLDKILDRLPQKATD